MAGALDTARERTLFIPWVLGSLCGLRRSEISYVGDQFNLRAGRLAVIASTKQTDSGIIRENEAKSDSYLRRPTIA